VLALLSDPDAESPLNCDAGNMIRGGDTMAFYTTAQMYTVENAFFIEWPCEEKRGKKGGKKKLEVDDSGSGMQMQESGPS